MTINKNFKSRPERQKYSKCMNFSLSGLDLKLLFMVTGAYYEGGLISPFITVIVRLVLVQHMRSWRGGTSTGAGRSKTFLCSFRRVGRGGANAPPPPHAPKRSAWKEP